MSGSESDSERPARSPDPGDVREEYDEELAALSGPAPSLRHAVIICVILVLSAYMLYWFYPDLSYLLRGLEEPEDLGEAADIVPDELSVGSYVTIHGLPMMHRSIEFKEGIKWFAMSDTTRKLFPLTGQSRLFVQWTEPEERRAFRDPNVNPERLALPYDFTGHLIDRSLVGGNYEKIWIFYDCLDSYSLRQCKHCLGLLDLSDCRRRFTCAEHFPADACEDLLPLEGGGTDADRAELDQLVAQTELDELGRRAAALAAAIDERRKRVEDLEREVAEIDSGQAKQRFNDEIAGLERRNDEAEGERSDLEARVGELGLEPDRIRTDVLRLKDEISLLSSETGALTRRATVLRDDAEQLGSAEGQALEPIAARIGERIRGELATLKSTDGADGGADEPDGDAGPADAGSGAGDDGGRAARIAELRGDLAALESGSLVQRRGEQLTAIKDRLASIGERKQALTRDLDQRKELARRLAELPREARERDDKLAELRGDLQALESGAMKEQKLAEIAVLAPGLEHLKKLEPRVADLTAGLARLQPGEVGDVAGELEALEELIGPTTWILVDGENPADKIWVVAVYVVFLVMIGFNLRRLYRFWIAWRA